MVLFAKRLTILKKKKHKYLLIILKIFNIWCYISNTFIIKSVKQSVSNNVAIQHGRR